MSFSEQQIPSGFKQTDVGVIPEDWECISFGDLFQQSVSRKQIKQSDIVTFIGMQDVSESAQLISPKYKTYEQVKSAFTYFEKSDVLVAKITPCFENGKGCHANEIETKIGFGSTEFHVLRAKENSDSKFIYFWTTRNSLRQDLEGEMVGSAGHRRVPFTALQNYRIPSPTKLKEQKAIANALSDVDALLTELEKLITKKQAIKTATMQQLLTGKTRLPQFAIREDGSPKGIKQSELGEIPEDWNVIPLGDLVSIQSGESPSRFQFKSDGVPYFKVEQLNNGLVFAEETEYRIDSKKAIDAGSIIFPKRGASILLNKIRVLKNDSYMDTNLMTLTCSDKVHNLYLYNTLIYKGLDQVADTTSIPQINNKHIIPLLITLPTIEEQIAIANIFSDMDNEIQGLEQRLAKTRKIKQGMMQELLTGRTRLPLSMEA